MKNYKCITNLTRKLSDAVDEVISSADEYEDLSPYRVLISELVEQHGFDEQYAPLLVEMIGERTGCYEIEIIGDEITFYHRSLLAQSLSCDRLAELLNNALSWISAHVSDSEIYGTLKNTLDMTDDEINVAGFDLEEPDEDETTGITM